MEGLSILILRTKVLFLFNRFPSTIWAHYGALSMLLMNAVTLEEEKRNVRRKTCWAAEALELEPLESAL